jgi:hypothetical protein
MKVATIVLNAIAVLLAARDAVAFNVNSFSHAPRVSKTLAEGRDRSETRKPSPRNDLDNFLECATKSFGTLGLAAALVLATPIPAFADTGDGASLPSNAKITTGGASTLQSGRTITITRGVNLDRSDFSNQNLKGVAFQQSIVRDSSFKNSNLLGASFFDATLDGSDFENADMSQCNLEMAQLNRANLKVRL